MVTEKIGSKLFGTTKYDTIEVDTKEGLDATRSQLALIESMRILTIDAIESDRDAKIVDDGSSLVNGTHITLTLDDKDVIDHDNGIIDIGGDSTFIKVGESRGVSLGFLSVYWDTVKNECQDHMLVLRIMDASNYVS